MNTKRRGADESDADSRQVTTRMSVEFIRDIDAYAAELSAALGDVVSRGTAVRSLIKLGLAAHGLAAQKKPVKKGGRRGEPRISAR